MTYDASGPWEDTAGFNAPLSFTQSGIAYWIQQKRWPREKLVVGIPLYGRGFRAAKFGDPAKGSYERSEIALKDVSKFVAQGWAVKQDAAQGVPYLTSPKGNEVISIEDAASVKRKAQAAKKARAAGIFFWEISQDFDGKTNPLVRAAVSAL